jgi:hypothetical protein
LQPSGIYNDGTQDWHLYLCTEILTADKVIGAWNPDGSVLVTATDGDGVPTAWYPIDPDYEAYICPMGNEAGVATDELDYHHWLGNEQRHVQAEPVAGTLPQYPAYRQPYIVTVTRTYIDYDGFPQIPHGFTFTIEFADPSRAPDARSFGVYSDAECTAYLWTPGAFQYVDSGEVDENDDPIMVWRIECPVGQRTATESEWHFAMLFGAAQEGRFTLPIGVQSMTPYLFAVDQGDTGGGSGWVDSGQTVTGMAGTVTLIQSNAGFSIGDQVRIDGHESEVTSTWTGTGLVLTPYKAHATGATVEIFV